MANKRCLGIPIGNSILHLPIIGDIRNTSVPYDRKLLTEVESTRLIAEGQPDHIQFLHPDDNRGWDWSEHLE